MNLSYSFGLFTIVKYSENLSVVSCYLRNIISSSSVFFYSLQPNVCVFGMIKIKGDN